VGSLSGLANGWGDGCDSAKSQFAQTQCTRTGRNDTARATLRLPRLGFEGYAALSSRWAVEQQGLEVGNPDASLFP